MELFFDDPCIYFLKNNSGMTETSTKPNRFWKERHSQQREKYFLRIDRGMNS
jgi:hypothetical protein